MQTTILRSTTALAATLALAATAFFPGQASADTGSGLKATSSEYETIKHKFNYSENFVLETKDPYGHKFQHSEEFLLETNDPYEMADISCGTGSSQPLLPCDVVHSFCASLGGLSGPTGCHLPDNPSPAGD